MEESRSTVKKATKWDAIVLTCSNKAWSQVLRKELEVRQQKGLIQEDIVLLVVEDPKSEVGSGGATINAILTVTEYISALKGLSVVSTDVISDCNILICHTGQTYYYEGCSRPFVTLPIALDYPKYDAPICNIDLLISLVTEKLSIHSPPGVWICSMDMVISIPESADFSTSFQDCEVCIITIPLPPKVMKDHGVCVVNADGCVDDIIFKGDLSTLELLARPDGNVLGCGGIVYMSPNVAAKLLYFYTKPPLDACTYMGLDSGQPPLKLSLFFDFLLPMTNTVSEEDFVRGKRGGSYGKPISEMTDNNRHNMEYARQLLWNDLHEIHVTACVIEGAKYIYMTNIANEHKKLLLNCPETEKLGMNWTNRAHEFVGTCCHVSDESCLINSKITGSVSIGDRCSVSNTVLNGKISIGKDSILSGLELDYSKRGHSMELPDSMVVQGFYIHLHTLNMSRKIYTVHGRHDLLMAATWKSLSTFCNQPWLVVLQRTGILKEDLWGSEIASEQQTISSAKLFPLFHTTANVGLKEILWLMGALDDDKEKTFLKRWRQSWRMSLDDVLKTIDMGEEFAWRRRVYYDIVGLSLEKTLLSCGNKRHCSYYNSASVDGYSSFLLDVLDNAASESPSPDIVARILANISDVLGGMARVKGGLRSGPAANKSWQKAFRYFENNEIRLGVAAMAKERQNWIHRPDLLIRAARHYEGAAQIFIRHAVLTAKKFFDFQKGDLPRMHKWIEAKCPARVDLSGGWSDTPPITYEHGGCVTILGMLINGQKPIGAKARRIKDPYIKVVITNPGAESTTSVIELRSQSDLEDYNHPRAPGALIKASVVCISLIDINSCASLKEQLMEKYGGGFEIHSWSNLPHGSGMGSSSILGGAVIAVLLTAAGMTFTNEGLVHAVLCMEQLLTTGGGWQDQVGGLMGGVHLATSDAELPLKVEVENLNLSKEIIQQFNERLILIYTGTTRLARNILQDVVRNWYSRNPRILYTEGCLVKLAKGSAEALKEGDFDAVSKCVTEYWEMKKRMAIGSETGIFVKLIKMLDPFVRGFCSCGAGGGGFVFGILKDPSYRQTVTMMLEDQEKLDVKVYDSCISETGMEITVED